MIGNNLKYLKRFIYILYRKLDNYIRFLKNINVCIEIVYIKYCYLVNSNVF